MKCCSFCAEQIENAAVKCRFCGEIVEQTTLLERDGVLVTSEIAAAIVDAMQHCARAGRV